MDFTYSTYEQFLKALQFQGFSFITFTDYLTTYHSKLSARSSSIIILRHDVEKRYDSALHFAKTQNKLGIVGTYFFRLLPKSFKPKIVKQIAELGHEIGYHYDDLTECKGDYGKAIASFQKNLKRLRDIAPVQTICMDGSPWSRFDNKDLWRSSSFANATADTGEEAIGRVGEFAFAKTSAENGERGELVRGENSQSHEDAKSHYSDYGIIGEPYFDIDFDKVFYLTDTGRRWDGWRTSLRDKVPQQKEWVKKGLVFHSTNDIIKAANEDRLPNQIMMTFHPQRWHEGGWPWLKELVVQNLKNEVKRVLVKRRSER